MRSLRQPDSNPANFVAPAGGVVKGTPLLIAGLVVVPVASADAGETFAGYTRGVFKLPKVDAVAMTAGHWVKWDVSAGEVVLNNTAAADFNLGRARLAAASDATHVEVIVDNTKRRSDIRKASITDVSTASDSTNEVAPFAGRCTRFFTQLQGAITLADSVVTPKIGATAMTGGAVTVAFTGSAAGDIDTAYPTALNVVAAGDRLVASTDGASTTAAGCNVFFEIEEL